MLCLQGSLHHPGQHSACRDAEPLSKACQGSCPSPAAWHGSGEPFSVLSQKQNLPHKDEKALRRLLLAASPAEALQLGLGSSWQLHTDCVTNAIK